MLTGDPCDSKLIGTIQSSRTAMSGCHSNAECTRSTRGWEWSAANDPGRAHLTVAQVDRAGTECVLARGVAQVAVVLDLAFTVGPAHRRQHALAVVEELQPPLLARPVGLDLEVDLEPAVVPVDVEVVPCVALAARAMTLGVGQNRCGHCHRGPCDDKGARGADGDRAPPDTGKVEVIHGCLLGCSRLGAPASLGSG